MPPDGRYRDVHIGILICAEKNMAMAAGELFREK
jgi:hypothetical protein